MPAYQSCENNKAAPLAQVEAYEAYARRDFKRAVDKLSELIYQQPTSARWSEMRAQVLLDSKNFAAAIMDYNEAMQRTPGLSPLLYTSAAQASVPPCGTTAAPRLPFGMPSIQVNLYPYLTFLPYAASETVSRARLLAGRGLALEGEESWQKAINDYQQALALAASAGCVHHAAAATLSPHLIASLSSNPMQPCTTPHASCTSCWHANTHASCSWPPCPHPEPLTHSSRTAKRAHTHTLCHPRHPQLPLSTPAAAPVCCHADAPPPLPPPHPPTLLSPL